MVRPFELFPPRPRSAPFLGRRRQEDALYRTIPGATHRGEAPTAPAAKMAGGSARILTYPEARRTADTR
jgi:hypothetical protein